MPSNLSYTITMGTGLALSVDPNARTAGSQLILNNLDDSSVLQRWLWLYDPSLQSSVLYNENLHMVAVPQDLSKGAPVILVPAGDLGPVSNANSWQVANGSAIRPPANTDVNLNALGNSWQPLSTKVGLWSWDGGKPNEVWTSTLVSPSVVLKDVA